MTHSSSYLDEGELSVSIGNSVFAQQLLRNELAAGAVEAEETRSVDV